MSPTGKLYTLPPNDRRSALLKPDPLIRCGGTQSLGTWYAKEALLTVERSCAQGDPQGLHPVREEGFVDSRLLQRTR